MHRLLLMLAVVSCVLVAASPARGAIFAAEGEVQVIHYTGVALPDIAIGRLDDPGDAVVAPDGAIIHRQAFSEFNGGPMWQRSPASFSLQSQADLLNANLVVGSTSASGRFIYDFGPGDFSHFVGWPQRIRLTQFDPNDQFDDPSVLRIDFSVEFDYDGDGIPFGGLPVGVDFQISGTADFAQLNYSVTWEPLLGAVNAEPVHVFGERVFLPGAFSVNEMNPAVYAPNGLEGNGTFLVSGFLQLQVKNDNGPAEIVIENRAFIPEPTSAAAWTGLLLAGLCRFGLAARTR